MLSDNVGRARSFRMRRRANGDLGLRAHAHRKLAVASMRGTLSWTNADDEENCPFMDNVERHASRPRARINTIRHRSAPYWVISPKSFVRACRHSL